MTWLVPEVSDNEEVKSLRQQVGNPMLLLSERDSSPKFVQSLDLNRQKIFQPWLPQSKVKAAAKSGNILQRIVCQHWKSRVNDFKISFGGLPSYESLRKRILRFVPTFFRSLFAQQI